MSEEIWRWADPNGQQRRVRIDELRASLASGIVAPNAPVWKPGWKAWQPAHEVPELTSSSLSAANGVVLNIPPPPLAVVAMQKEFEAQGAESFRPPPVFDASEEPPPPPNYVPQATKQSSLSPMPFQSAPPPAASSSPMVGLPTKIGLPPPPELQAMAAAAAVARTKSPPIGGGGGSRPGDPMIEELSGSMLLDEGPGGMPAPTDPRQFDPTRPETESLPQIPGTRSPLKSLFRDVAYIRQGKPPQNKRIVIVAAVVVGSTAILFLALLVSVISSLTSKSSDGPDAAASATPTTTASATTVARIDPIPPPPPASTPSATTNAPKDDPKNAGPSLADCALGGEAKSLGWRAIVPSGIEAGPVAGGIGIGFATGARDGIALSLDPSSLAPSSTAKARAAGGDARRVTPLMVGGKLVAVTDADRRGDKLVGRRTIATNPPIDIGVADGALVWAPHGKDSYAKLFTLDGEGAVEALRGIPLASEKGIAVAFRRGTSIYVGVSRGEGVLEPVGALVPLAGLGQVGAPSLATSGSEVVVAWADRGSAQESWQVRWAKMAPGDTPKAPATLPLPDGGPGVQAMSPSIAGLGGGRFLAAWTEGPVSNHQVRAISVNADGTASGSALAISAAGVNAGQPQAMVGEGGKGAVAFLVGKGKAGYEVNVAPLTCAAR